MKRKVIALLLIGILIMPMSFATHKDMLTYVGLGDSIALGMSAEPLVGGPYLEYDGYFTQYEAYLQDFYPTNVMPTQYNLGIPGMDSTMMFGAVLFDPSYREAIMAADVLTISIGGNDLLYPIVYGVQGIFDPTDPAGTHAMAMNYLYNDPILHNQLNTASAAFVANWKAMMDEIRLLNPYAEIFVLKLYNPVDQEEDAVLHSMLENLIDPMNKELMKHQNMYQLLNVDKAFEKHPEAETFDVRLESILMNPVLALDPHPQQAGHDLIFKELMKVRNPKSFK